MIHAIRAEHESGLLEAIKIVGADCPLQTVDTADSRTKRSVPIGLVRLSARLGASYRSPNVALSTASPVKYL